MRIWYRRGSKPQKHPYMGDTEGREGVLPPTQGDINPYGVQLLPSLLFVSHLYNLSTQR